MFQESLVNCTAFWREKTVYPPPNVGQCFRRVLPLASGMCVVLPKVLQHIHAETFPDISGNIKLWCQFGDIYADSTITWSKDGVVLAKVQRSAGDDSPDSLAIVQATTKDQGMYQCKLKNPNGKMSSEFRLTSEALNELISKQDLEVHVASPIICYREQTATECHVQNTARKYIKEYRADIKCTKAFGEVPEIIPVYLIHRPANNIPYATLEEELVGDFVKYSVKDGKEMNMMRRESDAGQKCCTFQHWVYKKTDGNLLVTDLQGVGMKLTDVGIATCGKGLTTISPANPVQSGQEV
ncbi:UNVERIFIED_CONTAM: hypothetical protein FKN15_069067 [Acipenser sinensis]